MMRRWAVAVVAGLAVLALAVPAQAKGDATKVMVTNGGGSGPGMGGPGGSNSGGSGAGGSGGTAAAVLTAPIHLEGLDTAGWIGDTGVFQEGTSHPTGALGPALDVRVVYTCGPGRGGVLRQQLYPYARGGAVAHTMGGQQFCDGPLPSTWWPVADTTMSVLHDNGLPGTMPKAAVQPAAGSAGGGGARGSAAASAAGSSSGVPVLPLALGISALVAAGGFAVIQMRRRRTVAA